MLSQATLQRLAQVNSGQIAVFRAADAPAGLFQATPEAGLSCLGTWDSVEPLFRAHFRRPRAYPPAVLASQVDQPPQPVAGVLFHPLGQLPESDLHYWAVQPSCTEPRQGWRDILQVSQPWLVPPLVEPTALLSLAVLAERVSFPIRMAMLECRLEADAPEVDLSLELDFRGSWREAVEAIPSLHLLGEGIDLHGSGRVSLLGLEFDAQAAYEHTLRPAVFVGMPEDDTRATFARCAQRLDASLWQSCQAAVEHLYDGLPEGAKITFFGMFPGRGLKAIRVNVNYPNSSVASAHLCALFPETQAEYQSALQLAAHSKLLTCAFDVYPDHLGTRVGFELDGDLLEHLPQAAQGLCPEKLAAVAQWSGSLLEAEDPRPWPSGLQGQGQIRAALVRRGGHLKVACQPGAELSFKVYPTINYLRFDPSEVEMDQRL